MNSDSDGNKKNSKRRLLVRHNSVGSISTQEIHEIIGVNFNKNDTEAYIAKHFKKPNVNKTDKKHGDSSKKSNSDQTDKGDGDNNSRSSEQGLTKIVHIENDLKNVDSEAIFKPNHTVTRTPPSNTHLYSDLPSDANKKRTRSSPKPERINKKKASLPTYNKREDILNEPLNSQDESNKEDEINNLETILEALEKIDEATNKQEDNTLIFTTTEQRTVSKSVLLLHRMLTKMVQRIGLLEKEVIEQKNNQPEEKRKLTYATVTSNPKEFSPRASSQEPKPWTTPPTNNRIETMIRIPQDEDAKKTMKVIRENVKNKDTDGGFKNIRPTKTGAVIIESHSKSQQVKLRKAMENEAAISIKELNKTDPMVMITGVEKGFS